MSVLSNGSLAHQASNAISATATVLSNSQADQNTRMAAGAKGGQNAQCGTVKHVGTSPGDATATNCMTPCCLSGNRGNTPPNQFCLPCWLHALLGIF